MNTDRVREILETLLLEYEALSPRELDARLGVSRGAMSPPQITNALQKAFQARVNAKIRSKPPVELAVMRSDDNAMRIEEADLVVRVGPRTDQIQITLTVPRSVGVYLDITRYKVDPKLLPALSDPQRKLLAAVSIKTGKTAEQILKDLLNPFLEEELGVILSAEDKWSGAFRAKLTKASLFPEELVGMLLMLK